MMLTPFPYASRRNAAARLFMPLRCAAAWRTKAFHCTLSCHAAGPVLQCKYPDDCLPPKQTPMNGKARGQRQIPFLISLPDTMGRGQYELAKQIP